MFTLLFVHLANKDKQSLDYTSGGSQKRDHPTTQRKLQYPELLATKQRNYIKKTTIHSIACYKTKTLHKEN